MIRIYNSLGHEKQDFKPLKEGEVSFYWCGPTVYDKPHLGHGRSAFTADIIRRYLEYSGYKVKFATNYTDIDDKMIERANKAGISVSELADKTIPFYIEHYGKLSIKTPDLQPRATEHIEDIIDMISKLEEKGITYVLDDGVYYDVSQFEDYGKLSGQKLEDLRMGSRVEVNKNKRNPYDFALWKFKKEGEPAWPSPWGEGRPGWHIECSAMCFANLGEKFDIHGGGLDLTFPHHECEIAQTEGVFGSGSFAQYWVHNGFININEEKMSKSLGNFFTLEDIFEKYDPKIVRLFYLQTHYKNPIEFSDQLLEQSKAALERLHTFVRRLQSVDLNERDDSSNFTEIIAMARNGFEDSMNEDFDTSGALGSVFDFLKTVNALLDKDALGKSDIEAVLEFLKTVDEVLSVIFFEEGVLDEEIESLIEEREAARANKDFEKADKIRDDLLERGIVLEDSPQGVVWKLK